jgi:hypothetical protein
LAGTSKTVPELSQTADHLIGSASQIGIHRKIFLSGKQTPRTDVKDTIKGLFYTIGELDLGEPPALAGRGSKDNNHEHTIK